MSTTSLNNKATDLDFFKEMFIRSKNEPVLAITSKYYAILTQKKLIHELFNDENLKTPEYQKCWAELLRQNFNQNPVSLGDKDLCLWAFPFLITNYQDYFNSISSSQAGNKNFQEYYKIVKNQMGQNITEIDLLNIIKKITKTKDMELAISIAEKNPSLVKNQKQIILNTHFHKAFLCLDKSGKLGKLAEVLGVTVSEFCKEWLKDSTNLYIYAQNVESLSYYWVNKIFNGSDITKDEKYSIFSRYFVAKVSRDDYFTKPPSEYHFLYQLYSLVDANKNSPKILEIILPYIREVFSQEKDLANLFDRTATKTENNFLWLLNFMKEHQSRINEAVKEPEAVMRLQTTLIKLEQKKIQQGIKKVVPTKSVAVISAFKV